MIEIKESSPSPFKIANLTKGWLEYNLKVVDSVGKNGFDLIKKAGIKFVYGNEKADFGISLHGNKVEGVPKKKCILFRVEPPIYNLFFGLKVYKKSFMNKYMEVMSDIIISDYPINHFLLPSNAFLYTDTFFDVPKTKFLCMVLSNKTVSRTIAKSSKYRKYSNMPFRKEADEFFCKFFGKDKYQSYGKGWNKDCTLGPTPVTVFYPPLQKNIHNNHLTLSQYKFSFCPENSKFNGYVTEKPLYPMANGCVPIYLGAPDVYDYLPKGTFIDYRDFTSLKDLCQYLIYMHDEEYQNYRSKIRAFIKSEQINKFSSCALAKKVIDVLEWNHRL